jgi:MoaA/NifB/PqqE/SkfB family radical SAM enzyme
MIGAGAVTAAAAFLERAITRGAQRLSDYLGPARGTRRAKARSFAHPAPDPIMQETAARVRADQYYYIDIVGSCNLTCPSCAVGNYAAQMPKGVMKLDTYKLIVEKIIAEHPDERIFIDLYNWGEAVLHKQLPDIIRYTKGRGIGVGISSNLNVFPNMREVVRAAPTYLRVSLSGYHNGTYQRTHRGGDVNVVKANMHMLRHHLDATGSDTLVQVGFHVYRTNFPDDFQAVRRLCRELGFAFDPILARYYPLENLLKIAAGEPPPEKDREILSQLVLSLAESLELARTLRARHPDCDFRRRRMFINYDGSVRLCGISYEAANNVAPDFLQISRSELQKLRYSHSLCKTCQAFGLDIFAPGFAQHLVNERAAAILGPDWLAR